MISIAPLRQDRADYYLRLAREDYYHADGEPPGQWAGSGAATLGLTGKVEKDPFFFMLEGIAPDGGRSLVQNNNGKAHHPGWDLTFSAPKSVSVLWALADPATRKQIHEIQFEAVREGIAYLEQNAAIVRRGPQGRQRERAGLVVATFEHSASRANDVDLHTHCPVMNVAVCKDGHTGALAGQLFYRHRMAADRIYMARLAQGLMLDLNLTTEPHGNAFEIAGFPQSLIQACSQRRQAILQELEARGWEGAAAAAVVSLETRPEKVHIPRAQLFAQTAAVAREHGVTPEYIAELLQGRIPTLAPKQDLGASPPADGLAQGDGQAAAAAEPEQAQQAAPRHEAATAHEEGHEHTPSQAQEPVSAGAEHAAGRAAAAQPALEVEEDTSVLHPRTAQKEPGLEEILDPRTAAEERASPLEEVTELGQEPAYAPGAQGRAPVPEEDLDQGFSHSEYATDFPEERESAEEQRTGGPPPDYRQSLSPRMQRQLEKAFERAFERATAENSYFTEREFVRYLAEECQWQPVGRFHIWEAARDRLHNYRDVVQLNESVRHEPVYTTQELLRIEKEMLARVERSRGDRHFVLPIAPIAIGSLSPMTNEQHTAYLHITHNPGRIQAVDGLSGSGKTTLLAKAGISWSLCGYKVIGVAGNKRKARELEEKTGIKSVTLNSLLWQVDRSLGRDLLHHAHQLGRAAVGLPTATLDERYLSLDRNTIVVLDGAEGVGTRPLAHLISVTEQKGTKLVCVGDQHGFASLLAGGAYAAICERDSWFTLPNGLRQEREWAREAQRLTAEGKATEVLQEYAERGLLHVSEDRGEARRALIETWRREGVRRPKEHVIFTTTREDAAELNIVAQEQRRRAGKLGTEYVAVDGIHIHRKDRVRFTKTSRTLNVDNGALGTVLLVVPLTGNLVVKLDDGRIVGVPLLVYKHIDLGYAMTAHAGHETTADRAYILMGGQHQDREISYTQLSRAEGVTQIFTDEQSAGPDLAQLALQMETSHQKELATAYIERQEEQQQTHEQQEQQQQQAQQQMHEQQEQQEQQQQRQSHTHGY